MAMSLISQTQKNPHPHKNGKKKKERNKSVKRAKKAQNKRKK